MITITIKRKRRLSDGKVEETDGTTILSRIERAARVCYKSEDKIAEGTAEKLIQSCIARGHESVIEHEVVTVKVICDRGVSHEIVRHRIASYSQESTRYCNYSPEGNVGEVTFVAPLFFANYEANYYAWAIAMERAEDSYNILCKSGATPQEARSVLPNSLKTEIVITMNLREWRHFFRLRTAEAAHPQMREITIPMLEEFKKRIPVIFDDIRSEK